MLSNVFLRWKKEQKEVRWADDHINVTVYFVSVCGQRRGNEFGHDLTGDKYAHVFERNRKFRCFIVSMFDISVSYRIYGIVLLFYLLETMCEKWKIDFVSKMIQGLPQLFTISKFISD